MERVKLGGSGECAVWENAGVDRQDGKKDGGGKSLSGVRLSNDKGPAAPSTLGSCASGGRRHVTAQSKLQSLRVVRAFQENCWSLQERGDVVGVEVVSGSRGQVLRGALRGRAKLAPTSDADRPVKEANGMQPLRLSKAWRRTSSAGA